MSRLGKSPVAGIFAMVALLGIMGTASADAPHESVKALLDGIGAGRAPHHRANTADYVHVIKVERPAAGQIALTLRIDDGFHINANPASLPYLIPTSVSFIGATPFRVTYPSPVRFKPKFADEPLNVYEGTVVITASFRQGVLDGTPALRGTVTAQACTDQICLPPADLPLSK